MRSNRSTKLTAAGLATCLLVAPLTASAHFVWIEVDPKAEAGKSQKIEIYFGEPHEFLREEAGGRLDQHDGLRAWVTDPKGRKSDVSVKKGVNRFGGAFVPKAVGRHSVTVSSPSHPVQNLTEYGGKLTKPLFYARTQFLAFETGRVSEREEENKETMDLDIVPVTKGLDPIKGTIAPKAGAEIAVRVMFKGRPLAKRRVNALGPNGWSKELQSTDSWGVTSFVPLWPGRYVLVVTNDENVAGEFKGSRYEAISHRASLSLLIEKTE